MERTCQDSCSKQELPGILTACSCLTSRHQLSNEHPALTGAELPGNGARFIRMPWFREELTSRGIIADTFETAITWEHFPHFYTSVKEATERAVQEAIGQRG